MTCECEVVNAVQPVATQTDDAFRRTAGSHPAWRGCFVSDLRHACACLVQWGEREKLSSQMVKAFVPSGHQRCSHPTASRLTRDALPI